MRKRERELGEREREREQMRSKRLSEWLGMLGHEWGEHEREGSAS